MYRTAMKKLITWKAKENRKPLLNIQNWMRF